MRIYKMTATFGKLEHVTLELKKGLNIIEAPNEWGKSTWCAFFLAMLYGLDTRAKSTKTTLADKERFAPWSGHPMAGRIDLHWNGQNITIERTTRGRVPMGVFRAYETASGMEIPELTAANCGAVLLGVEQSVFRRAGFIRQSDMPVTQDEALRRRLNALVTTGDETGDGDRLEKELKELKNRCRYNRTGLLPQAEAEEQLLEEKLAEWDSLENHSRKLKQRIGEEKSRLRELENHRVALNSAAAEADALRVAEARDARDRAEMAYFTAEAACGKLPAREDAQQKILQLQQFAAQWDVLQNELQQLPTMSEPPAAPQPFRDNTQEESKAMVAADTRRFEQLGRNKIWAGIIVAALVFLTASIFFVIDWHFTGFCGCLAAGMVLLILGLRTRRKRAAEKAALEAKYNSSNPLLWQQMLEEYLESLRQYQKISQTYHEEAFQLEARREALEKQRQSLCGSQTPQKVLELWQQVLQRWDQYAVAKRELEHTEKYLHALQAMVKPAVKPAMEDNLTYSAQDTERLIADARVEQQRLQNRLGQYQGRMEALGDRDDLYSRLKDVQQRIGELERIHKAASLGLETLAKARQELQRRFAPRISKRAQELLSAMTLGRYDRLRLGEDLSLLAGAGQEDTLHEALWRSDGTMDQLYFALRLAVAEELTPNAPLILDDAFVRFDDARLKAALDILTREAEKKQVILFTCQHREKELMQ